MAPFSLLDTRREMTRAETAPGRVAPQPLPDNIPSIQPGGGVCYQLELAWGRVRRAYLRRLRPGYVRRMAELREGDPSGVPHEVLDPRDLKFHRNQCHCGWAAEHDPFRWREAIPFARWGLAELQLMGYPLAALTILAVAMGYWYVGLVPGVLLALVVYFFRDPPRRVPSEPGQLVSPADGKVVEIVRLDHDDFIGGPAVRIGIFLSIFNVHINRAPSRCRVVRLHYSPGQFLNALDPASALRNENMWIGVEEEDAPHHRLAMRQIAGAIARRIVCDLRPGEVLERGQKFGMIKLGSRTELLLPDVPSLQIETKLNQRVKAGSSVLARFTDAT